MKMKYSAQSFLKNYFWASAVVTIAVVVLCFFLSPDSVGEVALDADGKYVMQLVSIFTLILVPLGIVYFNRVLQKADKTNKKSFDKKYRLVGLVRNSITALCAIVNAVAYFLIDYKSAIYCVAIGAVVHAYCFPSRKEYDALLEGVSTK